ncbi:GAF domain-containing protein [Streptomyces nigrescens]|uniref:GAF domain-containing protein n=2 Tax=Streptomyces nigrescens TaxID=1920 RepID=A0A640THY6_STRNI|nr:MULTISPECIES: GAF domain-containing protein [Streptomyces]MCX5447393.1 GAF domain-containing protein [Streptomyces libani]WAT96042.1 GAF domain-containing protein [Streptomyces libani subsp. libani]WAU03664.1 GAF domain-containing protein [Streptomyces nigrescens]GFE21365.1 transcriptional regulator [Streptomyces libani subsp. libani]GGW02436.1 transcriptional regulator [Streptomyces libani subsp. libani]
MSDRPIESAICSSQDIRATAHRLATVREAVLTGGTPSDAPSDAPRAVIGESWRRVRVSGVDPDRDQPQNPLPVAELEHRRQMSRLAPVLPVLNEGLLAAADAAQQIMVVTDAEGRVLWREGSAPVRRMADRLGFDKGAHWAEDVVGTNAIGTALVARRPVLVHSAEHFVRSHHQWTCAAAPLHDPRDGRLLGTVDVSGPAPGFHPTTLSLVSAVARLAEGELRSRHHLSLERLRSSAAPVLARIGGRALAVDPSGWVVGVTGLTPPDRVALPKSPEAGPLWLPRYGRCTLEPLPGGWLIRVGQQERDIGPSRVVLDVSGRDGSTVTVTGPAGSWSHELTPRHAELLFVLAAHPQGRSAAELARDLFGDDSRTVTVRAELSRLRRHLASVLAHRPYRFADGVEVELRLPPQPVHLLPQSLAPAVAAARRG